MLLPVSALVAVFSFGMLPVALQTGAVLDAPPEELVAAPAEEPGVTAEPFVEDTVVTGAARAALLKDIAAALGSVETAKGRFYQASSDYREAEGEFYLRRPGRIRFEYDAPTPLLIVADGTTVVIEDRDLETQDRVPLRLTPLAFLLDDELDFETEVDVLDVRRTEDLVSVTLQDPSGDTEGTLSLLMDSVNLGLLQWRTVDAAGLVTSVQLAGVETGMRINPRLFRIEDPDDDEERD